MCGTRASCGETPHRARKQSQAAHLGRLLAAVEQRLQAQADAQKRNAFPDPPDQRLAHAHGVERAQHLAEVADARQDDLVRAPQPSASRTRV